MKKMVALIAIIMVFVLFVDCMPKDTDETKIFALEYKFNKMFNSESDIDKELAELILADANISSTNVFLEDEIFIAKVKKNSFTIYYKDNNPGKESYHAVIVNTKGIKSAEEFLTHYKDSNYFEIGYGQGIDWEYNLKGNTLTPSLAISSTVIDKEEDYEIMSQRPHVEVEGNLVEEIVENIPFKVKEGNYFFAIDENTRMIGWFYFKSNYNGQDFVGCYSVSGWSGGNTTYEDVIQLNNLSLGNIQDDHVYIVSQ